MNGVGIAADVQSQALAGTEAPAGVSSGIQQQISAFVNQSFISSFRVMMWISAALALISALVSWRMIEEKEVINQNT